ncbi:phage tail sheath subtilisin-like domain-containing protein [Solirubrobacter ginsenosidimutans]|nr:phage tail sheath subtilisin-like domain-containing protein [Solirubrobacter ginsenosidimutans]
MAEMVIPGTYIEVRAEGLISAGQIATGIVGIVGTAARGPVGTPVTLSGFSAARDAFGAADTFTRPRDGANPLTLVRALEHVYNNGASGVIAVRAAGSTQETADFALRDASGNATVTLSAKTPGSWGNDIHIAVAQAEDDARVDGETQSATFDKLGYSPVVASPENQLRILRGTTRRIETPQLDYKRIREEDVLPDADERFRLSATPVEDVETLNVVRILDAAGGAVREYGSGAILYGSGAAPKAGEVRLNNSTGELTFAAKEAPETGQRVHARYGVGHDDPASGHVLITTWDGTLTFRAGEAPDEANGDRLTASYVVSRESAVEVTLSYGVTSESYVIPAGKALGDLLGPNSLVSAATDATHGGALPEAPIDAYFGTGTNTPGADGADATPDDYAAALEAISNELVNIVVLAGQDATQMGSKLAGHLHATEAVDLERIGVIGARGSTVAEYLGQPLSDERVVAVAPGLALEDGTALPAGYTAAAVAGLISSLAVQSSLTNKTLTVPGLSLKANRGEQEQLIHRNVLAVVPKDGFRIVKGITTSGEGTPFAAIPTRRIVDYAKYGVRSASNPYIGRLNNDRVRSALKATLDGFLTRMVLDEALTGYALDVTATRAQEIAGEVSVVMTLQPTFSIDYVRVVMNLK